MVTRKNFSLSWISNKISPENLKTSDHGNIQKFNITLRWSWLQVQKLQDISPSASIKRIVVASFAVLQILVSSPIDTLIGCNVENSLENLHYKAESILSKDQNIQITAML